MSARITSTSVGPCGVYVRCSACDSTDTSLWSVEKGGYTPVTNAQTTKVYDSVAAGLDPNINGRIASYVEVDVADAGNMNILAPVAALADVHHEMVVVCAGAGTVTLTGAGVQIPAAVAQDKVALVKWVPSLDKWLVLSVTP